MKQFLLTTLISLILQFLAFQSYAQYEPGDSIYHRAHELHLAGNGEQAIRLVDSGINLHSRSNGGLEDLVYLKTQRAYIMLLLLDRDTCKLYAQGLEKEISESPVYLKPYLGITHVIYGETEFASRNLEKTIEHERKALKYLLGPTEGLVLYPKYKQTYISHAYGMLGNCYFNLRQYDSSIANQQRALKYLDSNSHDYIISLTNLALICSRTGKCDLTRKYSKKAIDKTRGKVTSSIELVQFYSQLSRLAYRCKDYAESIRLSDSAERYYKDLSGKYTRFNRFYRYACRSYIALKDFDNARQEFIDWLPAKKSEILLESASLPSDKKVLYMNRVVSGHLEGMNLVAEKSCTPEFRKLFYEYVLFLKNYPLHSYSKLQKSIGNTSDLELKALYDQWLKKRNEYYNLLRFADQESIEKLAGLKAEIEDIEKRLTKGLGVPKTPGELLNANYEMVRDGLQSNEMGIEFIAYGDLNIMGPRYGAFIIKPGSGHPEYIDLCTADTIRQFLSRKELESELRYVKRIYESKTLYELLWDSIVSKYPEFRTYYVSTAGTLNLVNNQAIVNSVEGGKGIKIRLLSSTSELTKESVKNETAALTKACVIGGVQYDIDTTALSMSNQTTDFYKKNRGQLSGSWASLDFTDKEVDDIRSILESSNREVVMLKGLEASENKVKEVTREELPAILHFATHGMYLEHTGRAPAVMNSFAYTHSGLILSAANTCYNLNSTLDKYGDGVLTAPEISSLDLHKTKLVVLSACESGLGRYGTFGNIYGLQQAFKTAGAEYVIYSLWKVDDQVTKDFMIALYEGLMEKSSVQEAFDLAVETVQRDHGIFYWGAFQLIH